jgi:hypothetical protein
VEEDTEEELTELKQLIEKSADKNERTLEIMAETMPKKKWGWNFRD